MTWPSLASLTGEGGDSGRGRGEEGRGRGRSRVDEGAVSMKEATTSPADGAVYAARCAVCRDSPGLPSTASDVGVLFSRTCAAAQAILRPRGALQAGARTPFSGMDTRWR